MKDLIDNDAGAQNRPMILIVVDLDTVVVRPDKQFLPDLRDTTTHALKLELVRPE